MKTAEQFRKDYMQGKGILDHNMIDIHNLMKEYADYVRDYRKVTDASQVERAQLLSIKDRLQNLMFNDDPDFEEAVVGSIIKIDKYFKL